MLLVGIGVSLLLNYIVPFEKHTHSQLYDFIISIIITILVWEGNLRIDAFINLKFPWVEKPCKRIFIHILYSLPYSVLAIYLPMLGFHIYVCQITTENDGLLMFTSLIIGLLITIIIMTFEISTQFFYNWKNTLIEVEKYKTESAQAQLQNLKNQIDPHFLFNNMSILSSLVYKDAGKAADFINQLSKVYRYLLDNRNNELVTLDNELTFIKSYTYLLQIRFDKSIAFDFNVSPQLLTYYILPMSLQMLVENAIKHNEVSEDYPLKISITGNTNELIITNNLQLRSNNEPHSKTGLQNIKDRYAYYTNKKMEIIKSSNSFIVKIPLLNTL